MMMSANELGLSQVNFAPLQPPREMSYGSSYGRAEAGKPPAQALFEAFDTRLAARDAVSEGRMAQTDARQRQLRDVVRAELEGGFRDLAQGLRGASAVLARAPIPGAPNAGGGGGGGGGGRRGLSEDAFERMPSKSSPAESWKRWAVANDIPEPHTKTDLVKRYK
jgi:hypothetical protein